MPKTTWGIGTREFGVRDIEPNGSYVTTKFFVVFFIPLWPIDSRRIRRAPEEVQTHVKRLPLCWPQVIAFLALGYGICLAVLAFLVLGVLWVSGDLGTIVSGLVKRLR